MRRRLGPVLTLAFACLLACAGPAMALSNDGTVAVEYSGSIDQSFVYDASNPATWQGTLHLAFDEKQTVALSGRAQNRPTTKVVSHSLTVSGTVTNTLAPPNGTQTCTGTLSARAGASDPISVSWGNGNSATVGVSAVVAQEGQFVQSSAPNASKCASPQNSGGAGFVSPLAVIGAEEAADPATVTLVVPSNPYTKSYSANGSDSQVTESFHATLQVTASGTTTGPGPPQRTPAQIQAKLNALQALKQSVPASLYPCFATALGLTLVPAGLPGLVAGGTLVALGGPLCASYNAMFQSEVLTIQDPPRSDYGVVAGLARASAAAAPSASCQGRRGVVLRACTRARSAMVTLLDRTRATGRVAGAIEVTVSRESGAQRAHDTRAAARQNRRLIALNRSFADARRLQRAAGAALAKVLRSYHVAVRMSASQVRTAQSRLLTSLSARGLSAAHVSYVKRLLTGRALDVLNTLGR